MIIPGNQDVCCPWEGRDTGLQGQFGFLVMRHVVFVWEVMELVAVMRSDLFQFLVAVVLSIRRGRWLV